MIRTGQTSAGLCHLTTHMATWPRRFTKQRWARWTPWALRRPLAAAFRSVLLFASYYSFPLMLVLQACLLAFAMCLASYAVVLWRGIWAGIVFFALSYIYTRIFMPTSLTEPLGLFWALLSVPFFVASFRSGSVKPALVAFALTSMALMTRMGSMFTIPALLLWLPWQFGRTVWDKFKIGACAVGILLAVVGMNSFLSKAYGSGDAETGSNFSYTLCGLTIGTTWDGCLTKLADRGEPLTGDEAAVARRLYAFAWENFKENPAIFFNRLAAGAKQFVTTFPSVIWKGYGVAVDQPVWLFPNVLTLICLVGLVHFARSGMSRREIAFWALLLASITVSSAVIYFDDGTRVLAASHPLMALFLAMGLGSQQLAALRKDLEAKLVQIGSFGLIVAAAILLAVPWISYRLSPLDKDQLLSLHSGQNDAFVWGGREMSGFLIVSDEVPLRADIPSLHFSEFQAIVNQSGMEQYFAVLHPTAPATPFGFVFTPRLDIVRSGIFIVPAAVPERPDVSMWHFEMTGSSPDSGDIGLYVTRGAVPMIARLDERPEASTYCIFEATSGDQLNRWMFFRNVRGIGRRTIQPSATLAFEWPDETIKRPGCRLAFQTISPCSISRPARRYTPR